ncbi:MAG TPA: hypothetical protein DEQ61_14845 [Streptomyces sp.]|nr:hypothetical protein [Streptomyces sp.]
MLQQDQSEAPEVKDLAARFTDRVWNHPEPGPVDAYVTPGFVGHFPGTPDVHGPAELLRTAADLRRALPDLELRVQPGAGGRPGLPADGRHRYAAR